MIRSIFLDVDGTLYSHRIHDIPPSALRSLEALRRRGIRIFLATGRHRLALARMNLHGFPFDGYVTLTGHLCYDRAWRPVFRAPLPEADATALIRAFSGRRFPMLLLQENCTVTMCHSRTQNLKEHTLNADVLVVAVGKPGIIQQ